MKEFLQSSYWFDREYQEIKDLLGNGFIIDQTNANGYSMIHFAVWNYADDNLEKHTQLPNSAFLNKLISTILTLNKLKSLLIELRFVLVYFAVFDAVSSSHYI